MATKIQEVRQYFKQVVTNISVSIPVAATNTANEVAKVMEDKAKEVYLQKKISPGPSKNIIASFVLKPVQISGGAQYRAIVMAGGADAHYAVYVDQGHLLRNKKQWDGHNFMEEGFQEGVSRSEEILNKHFNNAFKQV